jgi:hypothetical protein
MEMARLIVEADPGGALLMMSVGQPEWESERMMEQLLSGASDIAECVGGKLTHVVCG